MRKLGPAAMKWLKILHLVLVVLFLGGILSSSALSLNLDISSFTETYATYRGLIIISDNIVRTGAVGTLLVSFLYGFLTTWGFFKHRWLTVKWILFILQTFVGILVVDRLMVANMALLESQQSLAIADPVFLHNHYLRLYVVLGQITVTLFIIVISVFKPWRTRQKVVTR